MNDNYRVLEDVVRDSYGGVVWSHKIQEKQSDIYAEHFKLMEKINIVAVSITSVGIIAMIITDSFWAELISALVSFATVYITAYYKSFDLPKLMKVKQDNTYSTEEIDLFLPHSLRWGANE